MFQLFFQKNKMIVLMTRYRPEIQNPGKPKIYTPAV